MIRSSNQPAQPVTDTDVDITPTPTQPVTPTEPESPAQPVPDNTDPVLPVDQPEPDVSIDVTVTDTDVDITPTPTQPVAPNTNGLEQEINTTTDKLKDSSTKVKTMSDVEFFDFLGDYASLQVLRKQYEAAKAREQSTPNKILGAAGIGATGIGGMMLASGLAEQSADAAAERDMRAYLATFRCDYGAGRNIVGGQTNIQLPGAGDLIQYTTEYKQIAANLKADKEALGMLPGIESDVVFDSATSGLYDNVSIGKTNGAFTSLSRALLDKNSADAAAWAQQTQGAKNKTKTGAITAGVGAGGSAIGNLIINRKSDDNKTDGQKTEINTVR